MSDTTATNLFIQSSLKRYAAFYQQLIGGMSGFEQLGNRVVRLAEHAQAFRRYDTVKESAHVLNNIPIKQYQSIGHYYLALCEYRGGRNPQEAFERVANDAPTAYRVRALQSLAAIKARNQDYASELYFFLESLKVSPSVESLRSIAVVKAKEGFHQSAVKDLESILPIARYAPPHNYFAYLNSLAIELGKVGRKNKARNIARHVLASPFIRAYPEWLETVIDLQPASRSFIVPDPSPARMGKLLSMPPVKQAEPIKQDRPATVISLEQWKKKMVKPDDDKSSEDRPKNKSEQVMYIMNHITAELNEDELDSIIERIDEVHAKKYKK
jgi:tetratricopeptide (TPR) repeat protein